MKEYLTSLTLVRIIYRLYWVLKQQYGLSFYWVKGLHELVVFWQEYQHYQSINTNNNFNISLQNWLPYLQDKTKVTPLDSVYFLQDTWAAKKIFELKPKHHYDVGSSVTTMGIISQYIPVTMIDIRDVLIELENFKFINGSILDLPLEDGSIESLSSLCVIEHIGLGRFGDIIDPWGSEKAIEEIKRVVKPGGMILCSVPIDKENKIYFNAHRAFTRDYILSLFKECEVIEEKYQYGTQLYNCYDANRGFGTGLYMLRKC